MIPRLLSNNKLKAVFSKSEIVQKTEIQETIQLTIGNRDSKYEVCIQNS